MCYSVRVAEVAVRRFWVIPLASVHVRSALSFEGMHSRLESLLDTDDRLIAQFAPSEPPRHPFEGHVRMGEVLLLQRVPNRRRRSVMLLGRGWARAAASGSELSLRFRPSTGTILLLALLSGPLISQAWSGRNLGEPAPVYAMCGLFYLLHLVSFWQRFRGVERVLRRAFNG